MKDQIYNILFKWSDPDPDLPEGQGREIISDNFESIAEEIKTFCLDTNRLNSVPYQRCPICNGLGRISPVGSSTVVFETCPTCYGARIIAQAIVPNQTVS